MFFFDLLSCYSHIARMLQTFHEYYFNYIFDVSIKEKRLYGSLCFELLPQQISQSKKKYMDMCQHANK